MRCIILGFGRVGRPTAQRMQDAGHDVTVIENDDGKFEAIRKRGLTLVEGDGSNEAVLERADLATADAVAALTDDLDTNLAACSAASEAGCRTVLRISQEISDADYERYSGQVDEVIYPERLGAIAAKNALLGGNIRAIADIAQHLQLVEFTITDSAPMKGYSLSELELPANTKLMAHGKGDAPLTTPDLDETLDAGDHLVVLADFDTLADVRSIVVGESGPAKALGGA